MRQPVWLPHFWRKDAIMLPYLSLFGRLMPPMACWGWPDWASACWLLCCAASASDCPGRLRLPVYLGRWGLWGQAALPAPPPAPAGCGAAPALGGARGVLCPLSLRRHGVLRRLFRRCGGGLGGGQIFKAPPVRLLPGAGARPASGARRGAGRLFLRRLLLWTGGSAPWA